MMSFVSDRPPPGQVDPRDLTPGQLAALKQCRDFWLTRVKGGWRCPGAKLVTLPTASLLGAKRLVVRRYHKGGARLEITGAGRNTLAVAEQRGRKRS